MERRLFAQGCAAKVVVGAIGAERVHEGSGSDVAVRARERAAVHIARAANAASDGSAEQLGALFAEAQAAKAFVNEAAARIVDRALALSGGAGYVSGSPLARAYRDVKAGSFMHPLGANRAYDYLGHVALGEETSLH